MPKPSTMNRSPAARALGRSRRDCPICDSRDLSYEFIVQGFPVCGCDHCGLLFLNPQPDRAAGESAQSGAPQMPESVYELHASNASSRLDQLMAYTGGRPEHVLMIANDPFLTDAARQQGLDVVSLTSGDVDAGALEELVPGAFEAAVFYCALERLSDPEAVLVALRRALAPSGVVMVIAPTIDSRTARLFRSAWWEFTAANLHYFSADTLQSLLIKTGYGDPIIDGDDSAVSLEYFRSKIPSVSSGWSRAILKLLVSATPPFLRRRAFHSLNSRRVVLVRMKSRTVTPKLSIIVPAFNERPTLATLMDRVLTKSIDGVDIEVIVVESNSTDGTRDEALKYQSHPRVKVILQDQPRGKGFAVRTGLTACTGDVVLFQDADLEYDVDDYDDLIEPLLAYRRNFVIGSRHVSKGRGWKMRQFNDSASLATVFNLGHVIFLTLFNVLYRQRLMDPFSMFKVFRRECLYGLSFECNRFDFDFEIVIKLLRKGYRPLELPVNYSARSPAEGKKVSLLRDPLTWVRALLKFRWGPLYTDGAS